MVLSYYGKPKFQQDSSELALNAGIARNITISDANLDSYGPFVRLHIENRSTEQIAVYINGTHLGDNTVSGATDTYFIPASSALDLTPYDDGRPDIVFQRVVIKNLDAANNTSNDEITTRISNV